MNREAKTLCMALKQGSHWEKTRKNVQGGNPCRKALASNVFGQGTLPYANAKVNKWNRRGHLPPQQGRVTLLELESKGNPWHYGGEEAGRGHHLCPCHCVPTFVLTGKA